MEAKKFTEMKMLAELFAKSASSHLQSGGFSPDVTQALADALEAAANDVPCGSEPDFEPTDEQAIAQSTLLEMAEWIRDGQKKYF